MLTIDDLEAFSEDVVTPDEKPYEEYMGAPLLREGYSLWQAQLWIFDQLDKAAEDLNWELYKDLTITMEKLEEEYDGNTTT